MVFCMLGIQWVLRLAASLDVLLQVLLEPVGPELELQQEGQLRQGLHWEQEQLVVDPPELYYPIKRGGKNAKTQQ